MKSTDLFAVHTSSKRLNEGLQRTFGKTLNLEGFSMPQLEDARNKLRTQISQVRSQSGFNENLENEAYTEAKFMLDAIVAELAEREEVIADPSIADLEEGFGSLEDEVMKLLKKFDEDMNEIGGYGDPDAKKIIELLKQGDAESAAEVVWYAYADQDGGELRNMDSYIEDLQDNFEDLAQGGDEDEGGETDDGYALASAGFGSDEDYGDFPESMELESAPPTAKGERMVKHIKKGYAKDGKLTDKEKSIAYATSWKQHNKEKNEDMNTNEAYINNAKDAIDVLADIRKQSKMAELGQGDPVRPNQLVNDLWDVMQWIEHNMEESIEQYESINTGEDMRNLREGEIQQAQSIVTAKTMVDRVGRWIEELSGMENDTLLQLGDQIRDEMGQEQAKGFLEAVAPAIQQALENLKTTREALASGVRTLTGEEQPATMLGGTPDMGGEEELGMAGPDAMNAEPEMDMGDDFSASEAGAGGAEAAGREQRESINFQNRLMKVLAG
jgi:hypothetical protein